MNHNRLCHKVDEFVPRSEHVHIRIDLDAVVERHDGELRFNVPEEVRLGGHRLARRYLLQRAPVYNTIRLLEPNVLKIDWNKLSLNKNVGHFI